MTNPTGKTIHLKGLNGIRAIAACSVLIYHTNQSLNTYGLPNFESVDLAAFGVTIFFSLSGFLITYLLLLEKERYGSIKIREFYIRRVLRIWPLYYLFLIAAVFALLLFEKESLTSSIWYYVLLFANIPFIYQTSIPILRHYWSLGVEEQFYLFWPWIVKKSSRLIRSILVFILVMMGLKALAWMHFLKTGNGIPLSIIQVTRFHCMAIGALGAVLCFQDNSLLKKISFSVIAQLISWGVIVLMALNRFSIADIIDHEIMR